MLQPWKAYIYCPTSYAILVTLWMLKAVFEIDFDCVNYLKATYATLTVMEAMRGHGFTSLVDLKS